MISTIMKGLWDREFMATHSVSGRKSPTDKSTDPPKPAIPADALQAIQSNKINSSFIQLKFKWILLINIFLDRLHHCVLENAAQQNGKAASSEPEHCLQAWP